jgi:xyloglucan-specific exo-beta-1,4-glucanase
MSFGVFTNLTKVLLENSAYGARDLATEMHARGRMTITRVGSVAIVGVLGFVAYVNAPTLVAQITSQPYTWRNVEIVGGGFVPGIVFNQSEPNLVYARTDIGGAYRLDPGTNRWIPLTDWLGWDDWNLTGIASLASDPVDPNRVYLAAGTYTNAWTSQNGAILRSTDRGATWQRSDLPFKVGGNMPGRGMGERLAVDPNRNSVLYFGAPSGQGLWRSTDSGVTWAKVTSFPNAGTYIQDPADPNGYLNDIIGVVWVTFDKRSATPGTTTQTIYAGVADLGTSVYRSTDGGATWSALSGQPTGLMPHKGVLDHAGGYLYLAYSNKGGPYDGDAGDVWKYNTATGAWTLISPVPSTNDSDNYYGYAGLTIDRLNPNTIMVSAYSSWWPDTIFWRSLDGGATWSKIWDWTRYPNRSFRYVQDITAARWLDLGVPSGGGRPGAEVSPKLGWMTETLEIDPFNSNRMMYGTGATIYGTDNLTAWDAGGQITITVKAMGLEETSVQDLASPPAGPSLLSALGDIAGFRHDNLSVAPATTFKNPGWSTTSSLDFAELNPAIVFRVGNGDTANSIKSAAYSTNGGTSWTPVTKQPASLTGGGTIAVSATGARAVWSPAGTGVFYTTSNGKTWTASTGVPAGARVISDRVNANTFYAFANGTFYVSTNGGASFSSTFSSGLPASSVRVKAVPGREGHVWLAGGASGAEYGLWRSTNAGASFTKLLNVDAADTVGFGKAAAGASYMSLYISAQIGGIRGIYRSDNEGTTWVRINDDQHQFAWTGGAMTGDPRIHGRVYVATNGRGIVYGDPR